MASSVSSIAPRPCGDAFSCPVGRMSASSKPSLAGVPVAKIGIVSTSDRGVIDDLSVLCRRRFWIAGLGTLVMMALAALLVSLVHDHVGPNMWSVGRAVFFAPIYLAGMWLLAPASDFLAVPLWLFGIAMVAIVGVASHVIAPRPETAVLSGIGFVAWAICMLLVAGSAV